MKPKFRRFPRLQDSKGRIVFVRVTAEGVILFRSQGNTKRTIALSAVWEALQAPDTFAWAVENLRLASDRFLEARQCTFAGLDGQCRALGVVNRDAIPLTPRGQMHRARKRRG